MPDIHIRREGHAGRVTLARPGALNALSYEMCRALDSALIGWAADDSVELVIIDAEGDKAFCAGGDIAEMYATGRTGDYSYGRRFWADEYRMNARLAKYHKPIISFLQGFVMGGGVGVGCHASHRVVCESTQIAMPECGIGLIPDVGGTYLLARAPGYLGVYLGLTGARMGPGDAIRAGFADLYLPRAEWDSAKAALVASGAASILRGRDAPLSELSHYAEAIDRAFSAPDLGQIEDRLRDGQDAFSAQALKTLRRNAPLSMACTLEMLRRPEHLATIEEALAQEYRFTWRSMRQGDFLEGIRAAIIDKDRSPRWQHESFHVRPAEVAAMLEPLGADELTFKEEVRG